MSWTNAMEPPPPSTTGIYSPQHKSSMSQEQSPSRNLTKALYRADSAADELDDTESPRNSENGTNDGDLVLIEFPSTQTPIHNGPSPSPAPAKESRDARLAREMREAQEQQPEARQRADNYAWHQALSQNLSPESHWRMTYVCCDCNRKVELKQFEPMRCISCGHRMLMKMRTNRIVQFEAR